MKPFCGISAIAFVSLLDILADPVSGGLQRNDPLPPFAVQRLGTVRFSHGGRVCDVAFSPDGRIIASGAWDHTITLWNALTGHEIRRLDRRLPVNSMAFSPDGKLLAATGFGFEHDRIFRVYVWDAATGKLLHRLAHSNSAYSVRFSRDSRLLASGASDRTIRVWTMPAGTLSMTLRHDGPGAEYQTVRALAFSPDSKLLASKCQTEVCVWEIATVAKRLTVEGKSAMGDLAFSPAGDILAVGDDQVRLLDVQTGDQIGRTPATKRGPVTSLAFSPDGRLLAASSFWQQTFHVWDLEDNRPKREIPGRDARLSFASDGRTLAVGADNRVRIWDMTSGRERLPTEDHDALHPIQSVAVSPDGKRVATVGGDLRQRGSDTISGELRLWNWRSGETAGRFIEPIIPKVKYDPRIGARFLAFSPDGKTLVSGSSSTGPAFHVWETASGKHLRHLRGHAWPVCSVAFSPDGSRVVSGSRDKSLGVWNVDTAQRLMRITGHQSEVVAAAYSPDGNAIASSSLDRTVRLWDAATGRQRAELAGHEGHVSSISFSADGRLLASTCLQTPFHKNWSIRIWDVNSGRLVRKLVRQGPSAVSVAFAPKRRILAAGGADHMVRLWDVDEGEVLLELSGHRGAINSLAFTPDGRYLITGSEDCTVLVWDLDGAFSEFDGRRLR